MSFIFEKVLLLSLTLSGVVLAVPSDVQIACRDETGKAVDWFSAYKLPKDSNSADANIQQGAGYTYLTENKQDWTLSKVGFDSTGSIIAKTLDSFYKTTFAANSPTGYVLYNDQYEEAELASRAHAKGVIYFDSKTAVWIVHSIPHYPPLPEAKAYSLDSSQMKYGQSMLCLTVPLSELEKVGNQLLFAWPQVIKSSIPTALQSKLPNLVKVANSEKYTKPKDGFAVDNPLGWANREDITTVDKNSFSTFYKHTKFASDLYSDFVAPQLKAPLMTETWSNGVGGVLGSDCKKAFSVNNIKQLAFKAFNVVFRVNKDHSKWALSNPTNVADGAVCIGDVNRMESQFKRGGGTICMRNEPTAWKSYKSIIDELEPCSASG